MVESHGVHFLAKMQGRAGAGIAGEGLFRAIGLCPENGGAKNRTTRFQAGKILTGDVRLIEIERGDEAERE